jgi:serine/threonine-protein kinase
VTTCPDLALLRRLLADELSAAEEASLARHVDLCPRCQRTLEELLDQAENLTPRSGRTGSYASAARTSSSLVGQLCGRLLHNPLSDSLEMLSAGSLGGAAPEGMPTVPGYEILGELGRGGMGVVYKARQLALKRTVALKMILGGLHAAPHERARLRSEAELVARLQHPNIVQVFEVGEVDGLPFLALEFVDGGTLAQRLASDPLPPRDAARLVATLAEAVHTAHSLNVVHRDLKPANVLLTAAGVPKIADFGLARGLDAEARRTHSGEILGTPSFMAPEQTTGPTGVGPAADVYALGAILYASLTGRPPFDAESVLATLLEVCHKDASPPSRLRPQVPRDLETICLKCLQKNPEKRYPSARELADDLNRYLRGEPVVARPVGTVERTWKWSRRHPAAAAVGAVSLASLVALLVVSFWYNAQLRTALDGFKARSQLTRTATDDFYVQVADKLLDTEPGQDALQQEFLEKALRVYKELARDEGDDPAVRRGTAMAHFRIGQICEKLGRSADAEMAFDEAIRLQQELVQQDPMQLAYRQELANSYNFRGELLRKTQRPEEALEWYDRALRLQAKLASGSQDLVFPREQARSEYNKSLALRELGRPTDALKGFDHAAVLLESPPDRSSDEPFSLQQLARVRLNRAVVLGEQKQTQEAIKDSEKAIALLTQLKNRFPAKPDYRYELAVSTLNLGNFLSASKNEEQVRKASKSYREACDLLKALTDSYPARLDYRREMANAHNSLGALLCRTEETLADAEAAWIESAKLFEGLAEQNEKRADFHFGAGQALGNLGWLQLWKLKQPQLAREALERAARHLEHPGLHKVEYPSSRATRVLVYFNLAESCLELNDDAGAAAAIDRFLDKRSDSDQERYRAARVYSRCLALSECWWSEPERGKRCQHYAQRALELLASVDPKRYKPERAPSDDEAFYALRGWSEFEEFLARLKS